MLATDAACRRRAACTTPRAVNGATQTEVVLALDPDSTVLGLVSWALAGFGAAFGPAIILSLYWPRMTRNGALAGILVGGVTVILWKQLAGLGGIFAIYELLPGFLLSAFAILVVSRLSVPLGRPSAI